MANSVDPDQTPRSAASDVSTLFAKSLPVPIVRVITVIRKKISKCFQAVNQALHLV